MAKCYESGVGVAKDEQAARARFRFGAEQGHLHSMGDYAFSDWASEAEKLTYLPRAAEGGHLTAMLAMSVRLRDASDPHLKARGEVYFRHCVEAGEMAAMLATLAQCFDAVPAHGDDEVLLAATRKVVGASDAVAMRVVGLLYTTGVNRPEDPAAGFVWFVRAAGAGDEWSRQMLKRAAAK